MYNEFNSCSSDRQIRGSLITCNSLFYSYLIMCLIIFSYLARQLPSYGDCLEVKREYYQNCSVLDCVTQCSQSAAYMYEQFLQVHVQLITR